MVCPSPFEFSQPKTAPQKSSSLIQKLFRLVGGGGDLHTRHPDPARRPPENTAKAVTIRFKIPF
jgi:hypothetical protein